MAATSLFRRSASMLLPVDGRTPDEVATDVALATQRDERSAVGRRR
jgi:hypothetical protein